MNNFANLSADLIRIGEYLYRGNSRLANKFISASKEKYLLDERLRMIIELIDSRDGGDLRAADRALTWGRLLLRKK